MLRLKQDSDQPLPLETRTNSLHLRVGPNGSAI